MKALAPAAAPRSAVPSRPRPSGLIRRQCACGGTPGPDGECAACRAKRLGVQRRAAGQAAPAAVPPIVGEVLGSPGQPLDPATRGFFETRFGHDFARVRVHDDARAARSAEAIDALAYTVGRDVVFGAGRYAPGRDEGRRLLAHELAHVVQQGAGPATPEGIGPADDPAERAADRSAADALSGRSSAPIDAARPGPGQPRRGVRSGR